MVALLVLSGSLSVTVFAVLIVMRVRVEERALDAARSP